MTGQYHYNKPKRRPRRRKRGYARKYLIAAMLAGAAALLYVFTPSCTDLMGGNTADDANPVAETTENALAILDDTLCSYAREAAVPLDSMPDDGCVRLHVNAPAGPLAKVFNDSNYLHYAEAEKLGIEPVTADNLTAPLSRPLQQINSCEQFYVADLSHSYPFLVPEAARLLHEIGDAFNDTLRARGGGNYRLKVTSLLRTDGSVRRLRRVNRCAVDSSAHRFGTTFDISYTRFMLTDTGGVYRTQEDLKNLLAEIVYDFRSRGRCYVKYERKSGCFHITTRDMRKPRQG